MRYSVELCEEEKKFLQKREQFVFEAMKKLLGKDGPKTINEVSETITRAQYLMDRRMIIFLQKSAPIFILAISASRIN